MYPLYRPSTQNEPSQEQPPTERSKGSVKRTREMAGEMAQTGTTNDMSDASSTDSSPSRPYRGPFYPPNRPRPPPQNRNGQGPPAISRPRPSSQWPLPAPLQSPPNETRGISAPRYQPPPGSSRPQRPPRPSVVPSMLDATRLLQEVPNFQSPPPRPQPPPPRRAQPQSPEQYRNHRNSIISPVDTSPTETRSISSRPTTTSSAISIPEFPAVPPPAQTTNSLTLPIQVPQYGPRRSAILGPPPSSRRGASSYYSQASFVSPIPEESPRFQSSHASYASSAAMPSNWEDSINSLESPAFYIEEDEEDDSVYGNERAFTDDDTIEERPESPLSNNDERGLVRQASLGRRGKPSMVMTKSFDSKDSLDSQSTGQSQLFGKSDAELLNPMPVQSDKLNKMGVFGSPAMRAAIASAATGEGAVERHDQRQTAWPSSDEVSPMGESPLAGGTGFIDISSSDETLPSQIQPKIRHQRQNTGPMPPFATDPFIDSSSDETPPDQVQRKVRDRQNTGPLPPFAPNPSDAAIKEVLDAHEAASSLPSNAPRESGFSRLSAIRRPPRLNIDAVREAEARGSLTSLPDLIKRATTLAAMMSRGERPGSRVNILDDYPSDAFWDKEANLDTRPRPDFSDMIAAFPPPGDATPSRSGTPARGGSPNRPVSVWPSFKPSSTRMNQKTEYDADGREQPRKKRKCCGLPLWLFWLLLFILLCIIAAAVVVPVELLVVNKSSSPTSPTATVASCEQSMPCNNGGTSAVSNNTCMCMCTNGFTGSTCSEAGSTGCTSISFASDNTQHNNITIGEAIPPLLNIAQANFSIPLSITQILGRFNNQNISCISQNALVTFNGDDELEGSPSDSVAMQARDHSWAATSSGSAYLTAGNVMPTGVVSSIVYDTSSMPSFATATATASPTGTASSSSATSTSTSASSTYSITQESLDFARVALLYVLQEQSLSSAVTAQVDLQKFFTNGGNNKQAASLSIGGGSTVDLVTFGVTLDGQGSVGVTSGSGTSSKTKNSKAKRDTLLEYLPWPGR